MGIKNLSSDELALILEDQKDLYTEEELERIYDRYEILKEEKSHENKKKAASKQKRLSNRERYNRGDWPSRIICPKCDGANGGKSHNCQFCGHSFANLSYSDLLLSYETENEEYSLEEDREETPSTGSPPGCFMYFFAILFPILGVIIGAINLRKPYWKGLFIMSLVLFIISIIIYLCVYMIVEGVDSLNHIGYYRYY